MQPFLHRICATVCRLSCFLGSFMLVGLGIAIVSEAPEVAAGFLGGLVLCSFWALVFRRLRWMFSVEGRRSRVAKKFADYEKKIKQREQQKRDKASHKSELSNIRELIHTTTKELKYRKNDITPNIFSRIILALKQCENDLDIEYVYNLYNIVTTTDIQRLSGKLNMSVSEHLAQKGV